MSYVYAFLGIAFLTVGIMAIPFPGTIDEQMVLGFVCIPVGGVFLYGFFKELSHG